MLMRDQPAHLFAAKILLEKNITFFTRINLALSCHEIQIRHQKGYEPYCVVVRQGIRATLGPLRTYFYYCTIVGLMPVIP